MVARIASIILRLCGALAVILGLVFWSGNAMNLIPIHMLLGILVVLSMWVLGIGQALARGGSWPLAIGALLLGLVVVFFGMRQSSIMPGSFHWVVRVVHMLLGIAAMGVGQNAAARWRNTSPMREEQPGTAA